MRIGDRELRAITARGADSVSVIDQRLLPHELAEIELRTLDDACHAIADMAVRGAPLIGATAAYGIFLAAGEDPSIEALEKAGEKLVATRPTAVNLKWAVDRVLARLRGLPEGEVRGAAWDEAGRICDEDAEMNRAIGEHGLAVIREASERKGGEPVNVLTHCNAGWLACVDWGTATSAIYQAHEAGLGLHVWVDETRPRNQGAFLTAWELGQAGVPHTVVADNAGGHLMQRGEVDLCIVGTDRTVANGDVCNKIGTYLKALAAHDNGVPFYVALPSPTIDAEIDDGVSGIDIEERSQREVTHVRGRDESGRPVEVGILPEGSAAANPAFDVTPARLVTGLITERGVAEASREGLAAMFPELFGKAREAGQAA